MSLLVPREAKTVTVHVRWGDYQAEFHGKPVLRAEDLGTDPDGEPNPTASTDGTNIDVSSGRFPNLWKRVQRDESVSLKVPDKTKKGPAEQAVPDSRGLYLALSVRPVPATGSAEGMVPPGTRSVSVFLVNRRHPAGDEIRDQAFAFQTELEVHSDEPLVPRPNVRGLGTDDWDERVADLQYRDVFEYAVGHGVATRADLDSEGHCRNVRTCWIPDAEVERVEAARIEGVVISMEALARLADGAQARASLDGLVTKYREWIAEQRAKAPTSPPNRREIANELLNRAGVAANRIEAGIALLEDPQVLEAFRIANRVMARSARQRFGVMQGKAPDSIAPPEWRPFQLAFLLMNLAGIARPTDDDRDVVDLLFFPTGGGKTEAYLGLAAFTLVLRRLRDPGITSAGLSVLMRYTLRLLTLDQLGRASTLICALELERQDHVDTLGAWPFEIGLWVGQAATPNYMGRKGDNNPNSARQKTMAYKTKRDDRSPIPLENCPWCGEKFTANSFNLVPNPDHPIDLRVVCVNRRCEFTRNQALPIIAVDERIYRRLPCFLIATVDKFAAMPWTGQVGGFFGRVERFDKDGFYGPCEKDLGRVLDKPLPPPDLVIQDELHLISGPMGTMVGLYESALDALCTREVDGKKVRPKVIASTATVRRAESQIRALFNRRTVDIFPPPVPDRRDSFFAQVQTREQSDPRLYLGIAAQGRSPKVILLRAYLALLGAAQKAYEQDGGKKNPNNAADPYMTLLGYFNSLRELGGSRRIVEDEVKTRLEDYASRKRVAEKEGLFANREIAYEVVELTSRVSTSKVAEAKRRLAVPYQQGDSVDVAIATNMISVGLDITRLGLMVVLGQPKTCAEYIQATSRVGRQIDKPGLVITLINIHRPRDRSHFERFETFHQSFYRSVEATSVTPFSPRALDRGLAGTLVALARLGHTPMTPPKGAIEILHQRSALEFAVTALAERARSHASLPVESAEALRLRVQERVRDLLDEWSHIADDYRSHGVELQYQEETGAAQRLLYEFLDPDLKKLHRRHHKFRANRSMRDVEPSVNLWLRTLDDCEIEGDQE